MQSDQNIAKLTTDLQDLILRQIPLFHHLAQRLPRNILPDDADIAVVAVRFYKMRNARNIILPDHRLLHRIVIKGS